MAGFPPTAGYKMQKQHLAPILKWVGGKRQLLDEILKRKPKSFTTYYEPFLGGGAVFLALQPKRAVLNDRNDELINVYLSVRDHVNEVVELLKKHKNEEEYYYNIRQMDREPDFNELPSVVRAARILYLNKTCYNGLFRVNSQGEFNSPFGRYKSPNIVNKSMLEAVSHLLNKVDKLNKRVYTLLNTDFEEAVATAKAGSFIYFDPPYEPVSDSSNFTGYNQGGFTRDDQRRLYRLCTALHKRRVKFMLSNSSCPFIHGLYKRTKAFRIEMVQARRSVNADGEKRGNVNEVLVRNYE